MRVIHDPHPNGSVCFGRFFPPEKAHARTEPIEFRTGPEIYSIILVRDCSLSRSLRYHARNGEMNDRDATTPKHGNGVPEVLRTFVRNCHSDAMVVNRGPSLIF